MRYVTHHCAAFRKLICICRSALNMSESKVMYLKSFLGVQATRKNNMGTELSACKTKMDRMTVTSFLPPRFAFDIVQSYWTCRSRPPTTLWNVSVRTDAKNKDKTNDATCVWRTPSFSKERSTTGAIVQGAWRLPAAYWSDHAAVEWYQSRNPWHGCCNIDMDYNDARC